jgi:hypothetical protein
VDWKNGQWWKGMGFLVGSTFFIMGAWLTPRGDPTRPNTMTNAGGLPSLVPAVDENFWGLLWAVNFPFLIGASFFLLAALLAFALTMNTRPIGHGVPPHHLLAKYYLEPSSKWSIFTLHPRRVDWWSNLLQLLGAAIFEFNSIAAGTVCCLHFDSR